MKKDSQIFRNENAKIARSINFTKKQLENLILQSAFTKRFENQSSWNLKRSYIDEKFHP